MRQVYKDYQSMLYCVMWTYLTEFIFDILLLQKDIFVCIFCDL